MKNSERRSAILRPNNLLTLLSKQFHSPQRAYELFDKFLRQKKFNRDFCLKLIEVLRQRAKIQWEIRRLAVLMLENQILKLQPDQLEDFDFLFTQLNLKEPGIKKKLVESVLREGYTTTELSGFICEFRRRLARLSYVHQKINGFKTHPDALNDFVEISKRDCKLSLARYLFHPEDVVDQILRQLEITGGVKDLDDDASDLDDQLARALKVLPRYEGTILKQLCKKSNIYWVSETTSSEINSLVEYPATTVVLVVKPPGSDIEFEFKRAGRRGTNVLSVVYARDGWAVPPSHRLDGGSMQWLLQYEADAASRLALIYRVIHDAEAPIPAYVSRSTVFAVPTRQGHVQTIPYFTDERSFGRGFNEMRSAMAHVVTAFAKENDEELVDLPGDLGLTVHFLGQVAPAQSIVSGTSSFRLDKLATYLSEDGPQIYFIQGLKRNYSNNDARRFADQLLEEVLGVYQPPNVDYINHEQYVKAALVVPENRTRANNVYLSLLQQIATFWGTLLGIRGHTKGESFVARNVGLKSVWESGQWIVKIIFMDHDLVSIPSASEKNFYAFGSLPNMSLDERYIWGRSTPEVFATTEVGYLNKIYRISPEIQEQGHALAKASLKNAYQKTRNRLLTNQRAKKLFASEFREKLFHWDTLVHGYFQMNGNKSSKRWKDQMKKALPAKTYKSAQLDTFWEVIEKYEGFLGRNSFIFDFGLES